MFSDRTELVVLLEVDLMHLNRIQEFVTISSTGSATDFGDFKLEMHIQGFGISNSTRGFACRIIHGSRQHRI